MPCHIVRHLGLEEVGQVLEVDREAAEVTEIQAIVILCSLSNVHNCEKIYCTIVLISKTSMRIKFLNSGKHASHIVEYLAKHDGSLI